MQDRTTCRMMHRLLTPDPNDLGDIKATPRGWGFAAALSPDDIAAVADPATRGLFAGLWPGRTGRNRRGRVAKADAVLSAAGAARGSLGPLCARGRRALPGARALGALGHASGIGW